MSPSLISAAPGLLGVMGWPLTRTHSPALQQAGIRALQRNWIYGAFAVPPEKLTVAIQGAAALGFVGLNLTAPHKVAAMRCCQPDPLALRVGAVNTLVFQSRDAGAALGLNTDVHGFHMLLEEMSLDVGGQLAVVLGGGGAAVGVVVALGMAGAQVVCVTRRGVALGLQPGDEPRCLARGAPDLAQVLAEAALFVDATSRSRDDRADVEAEIALLAPRAVVVDLAVRRNTALIDQARSRGLRAAGGELMLLHQGAQALQAWSGQAAPLAAMRAALKQSLQEDGEGWLKAIL